MEAAKQKKQKYQSRYEAEKHAALLNQVYVSPAEEQGCFKR
jgi:hypothetical protein